jgi:hypothetical protein
MRSFAAPGTGLRVEPEDRQPVSSTSREQLGYWLLVRLQAVGSTQPIEYVNVLPDFDEFELRGAANWLVVSGYATWASGSRIVLTDSGRHAIAN